MTAVRSLNCRPPCLKNMSCMKRDARHLADYSHPDDDDYGFAVRCHGGTGKFATQRQCFNFMDPYQTGYVAEKAAIRELLRHLGDKPTAMTLLKDFQAMDTDGNGYISFPEFVEWASNGRGAQLCPQHIGYTALTSICSPCTMSDCSCSNFKGSPGAADDRFCQTCNHNRGYHSSTAEDQLRAIWPPHWKMTATLPAMARTGGSPGYFGVISQIMLRRPARTPQLADFAGQQQLIQCGSEQIAQMQRFMDASARNRWTRDRGRANKVPIGFKVVRVERNENARLWLKYSLMKSLLSKALITLNEALVAKGQSPIVRYEVLTTSVARELNMIVAAGLDESINEWYLWHGASSTGAQGIAQQEFKQYYAGSTTGTLYGRGTYLSDSCTKADEYAKQIEEGDDSGLHCLLLCRVMGGNVRYTDAASPDASLLERDVFESVYNTVFGDREKTRDTFKEFVIYDSSQAYPEYLVYYKRIFVDSAGAPSAFSPTSASRASIEIPCASRPLIAE